MSQPSPEQQSYPYPAPDAAGSVLHRPAAAPPDTPPAVPGQRPATEHPVPTPSYGTVALSRPASAPAYPSPAYPSPAYPSAQPVPGQPYPGQPYPGQPYPGQPYPGQPYPGQPYPAPFAEQAQHAQAVYGQVAPAPVGPAPTGVGQPPGWQAGTGQAGTGQAGTGQAGTGQADAGEFGAGRGAAEGEGSGLGRSGGQWSSGTVVSRGGTGALAGSGPPPGPRGTVYQHGGDSVGSGQRRRLARLRIGAHVANPAALGQLATPSPGAGLLVGADRDRQPVLVRLFRAEPTEIVLIGGAWAARLLAFRALALGAAVFAVTAEPAVWDGLGAHAVGHHDRVQLSTVELPRLPTAAAHRPVLVIRDTGRSGAAASLGPWQTRVTVMRQLDHNGMDTLSAADLTIMQRLAPDEAQLASYALRMSAQSTQLVQVLEPEMLALMGGGANRYVWLRPTSVERSLLGAAQR